MTVNDPCRPILSVKIEPKTRVDEAPLSEALAQLMAEDPSFVVMVDPESYETILKGASEQHLDLKIERLIREHGIGVSVGELQVAYLETLMASAEAQSTFQRVIANKRHQARVKVRVELENQDLGNTILSQLPASTPDAILLAIEDGVRQVLDQGVLLGFPMTGLLVTLLEAEADDDASSALAFQAAARKAMKQACETAGVKLLEPVMALEITTPGDFIGAVRHDLNERRGEIKNFTIQEAETVISTHVPFANLFGYASNLHAIAQGQARYAMTFSHYRAVPRNVSGDDPDNFPPAIGMRA